MKNKIKVHLINKVLFSLLAFFFVLAQLAFAGASGYDKQMRREFKMPPEWFTCQATSDCGLVAIPCMAGLSVSVKYKETAQSVIDKQQAPSQSCGSIMPDHSSAISDNGQCVTTRIEKVTRLSCRHGFKIWVKPPNSPNDEIACDEENLGLFKTYLGRCNITEPDGKKYDFDNDHCVTCTDYSLWKDNIKKLYQEHKRSTDGQSITFAPCDK